MMHRTHCIYKACNYSPPFEKLLVAVIAEHVLLAAKLAIGVSFADGPTGAPTLAREVAEQQRRKFLLNVHGLNDTVTASPTLRSVEAGVKAAALGGGGAIGEPRLVRLPYLWKQWQVLLCRCAVSVLVRPCRVAS